MPKDKNRIWHLLGKKLAGEASEEELNELGELIKENPDFGFYAEITDSLKKTSTVENTELDESYNRVAERLQLRAKKDSRSDPGTDLQPAGSNTDRPRTNWPVTTRLRRYISNGILANYVKFAWRGLVRRKAFSFINIAGLSIGMASAILIFLWINDELTYDLFHKKKDRIYQAMNRTIVNGSVEVWSSTAMPLAPVLKKDYPEAEDVVRTNWVAAFILKVGERQFQTEGFVTDPGFLTMFDFPLLSGDPETALSEPHSIVISRKLSKKLFGDEEEVVGKKIRIDSNAVFTVTGVAKDIPNNTRFHFDYLVPWSYMKEIGWENPRWDQTSITQTYVLLKPGVTEEQANSRFKNVIKQHSKIYNEIFLHPLRKWRLWSDFTNGKISGGAIKEVRIFGIIAVFILLIACINYMNLSTARSVKRAREVGVRKISGAGKGELVWQFLGESVLISLFAGIISLILVFATLPAFNRLMFKELAIPFQSPVFWVYALGFVLLTGILAGSYPAFYLSAYKPARVLKGTFQSAGGLVTPRKILVVLQFTFAIVLSICTIVIYRQIAYGHQRDTGYNMDNLAYIYVKGDMEKNYPLIREAMLKSGAITGITRTNCPVTEVWELNDDYQWKGKDPANRVWFVRFYTDRDMVKTVQLKMVAGRAIDAGADPTDSTAVMLNETAVKTMGLSNPIGQLIKSTENTFHVVGVVKDFIPGTPFQPLYPMIIQGPGRKNWFGTMTFRLNRQHSKKANLAAIQAIMKKYNPEYPFQYFSVDESYEYKFAGEQHFGRLAALFAGLTIFISCLGLFGLATYMAENRIKEIGIRKVFGASVSRITALLSKDFIKLVSISFLVASPLAWWGMHNWLQQFAYHVGIGWWVFVVTGILSVVIAMLTVSYQAIKAAVSNPVLSLRNE